MEKNRPWRLKRRIPWRRCTFLMSCWAPLPIRCTSTACQVQSHAELTALLTPMVDRRYIHHFIRTWPFPRTSPHARPLALVLSRLCWTELGSYWACRVDYEGCLNDQTLETAAEKEVQIDDAIRAPSSMPHASHP